jgi:hypothetical protein
MGSNGNQMQGSMCVLRIMVGLQLETTQGWATPTLVDEGGAIERQQRILDDKRSKWFYYNYSTNVLIHKGFWEFLRILIKVMRLMLRAG